MNNSVITIRECDIVPHQDPYTKGILIVYKSALPQLAVSEAAICQTMGSTLLDRLGTILQHRKLLVAILLPDKVMVGGLVQQA